MATVVRMHTEDDIDELSRFWSDNSGWDQIDRNEWERRFYHTPFGHASVAIAHDNNTNEILGQLIFIPTVVSIEGSNINAYRPFALVVKQRKEAISGYLKLVDIVGKMYHHATKSFKEKGTSLIHMMPDPRWARLLKFLPGLQIGSFPLWTLPLAINHKFEIPDEYATELFNASDERINKLWEDSSKLFECAVVRNTHSLPWKTSHGNYILLGISKNNELIGLVVSIAKLKDKQWLICDMLAADNDQSLTVTIQAACNLAYDFQQQEEGKAISKIAILVTPAIEKVIEPLGFKKDNYQFPMLVHLLDNSLSKKQVAPEKWYVSAND